MADWFLLYEDGLPRTPLVGQDRRLKQQLRDALLILDCRRLIALEKARFRFAGPEGVRQ